ncbi:MAG: peptidoglycan-binding domain-containing protein, partial [Eubacteriales bacterium]|nr:peptidoglycan-binding domain-containing protein [Eubacteriales bacterium]
PTPAPVVPQGEVIDGNSDPELIFEMQQKLYAIGYMTDPISVSGRYDKETKNCVAYFQRDLNDYYGQNLAKSGHIDRTTRKYLEKLYEMKPAAERHNPPVVMGETIKSLNEMLNEFELSLSASAKMSDAATTVKWVQKIMQKWGYYDVKYKPTSVYDQQMFDLVATLRADLMLTDPTLEQKDPALTGVIDRALFEYIKQMHLTDPNAIPAGSPLVYKVW